MCKCADTISDEHATRNNSYQHRGNSRRNEQFQVKCAEAVGANARVEAVVTHGPYTRPTVKARGDRSPTALSIALALSDAS